MSDSVVVQVGTPPFSTSIRRPGKAAASRCWSTAGQVVSFELGPVP